MQTGRQEDRGRQSGRQAETGRQTGRQTGWDNTRDGVMTVWME